VRLVTLVPGIDAAVAAAVVVVVVVDDGVRTKSSQTTSYQCDRLDCGTVQSVDRGSASVVPKIPSRACRVPGQSSQCSSVRGAWPHLGQLGSTVLSIKCLYA